MRSKRSSASGVRVASSIGSVCIAGFYYGSYVSLAVTGTAVNLERAQFAGAGHVEYGCLAHAELLGDFLPCEGTLFLGIHIQREDSLACGFDCVHHKLMEVGEVDSEENIGGVRVGHRRLKKVKKIQFHLGGMNLKDFVA